MSFSYLVLLVLSSVLSFAQDAATASPLVPGRITGTVVDATGADVAGARVKLTRDDQSPAQEVLSDSDGQFSFTNISPGPFHLTITSSGFATQSFSEVLQPGQTRILPPISMAVATAVTEIQVKPQTQEEVAQEQIKEQEQQRVLGVVPNFFVTYVPNAAPLNARQKFELSWKTTIDPVSFALVGAIAGIEQAQNTYSGYGQGAAGYAKRYGASYATLVAGTFFSGAIFPSLLKQDPRYFYKGTGTRKSRALYAIANSVICKGDNGRWQPNYSNILGNLAAGGISNLYYPEEDRQGAKLTFENAAIGIGATAAANLLEEFVVARFTPKGRKHDPSKPQLLDSNQQSAFRSYQLSHKWFWEGHGFSRAAQDLKKWGL